MTTLLAVVVLTVVHPLGPVDERTLADQRNGLLRDGPVLLESVAGVGFGGHPVVLLFLRAAPAAGDVRLFAAALPARARLRLVVQSACGGDPGGQPTPVARDPGAVLARAVELPPPERRRAWRGYAVVDSTRTVRYSILDPSSPSSGFEAATIIWARP